MKIGSLVECIVDWTPCRLQYGYKYPNKGDTLTVSGMRRFVGENCDLSFEEGYFGDNGYLFSTTVRELQPPMDMSFIEELQFNEKEVSNA
jgi:hypothetical protein